MLTGNFTAAAEVAGLVAYFLGVDGHSKKIQEEWDNGDARDWSIAVKEYVKSKSYQREWRNNPTYAKVICNGEVPLLKNANNEVEYACERHPGFRKREESCNSTVLSTSTVELASTSISTDSSSTSSITKELPKTSFSTSNTKNIPAFTNTVPLILTATPEVTPPRPNPNGPGVEPPPPPPAPKSNPTKRLYITYTYMKSTKKGKEPEFVWGAFRGSLPNEDFKFCHNVKAVVHSTKAPGVDHRDFDDPPITSPDLPLKPLFGFNDCQYSTDGTGKTIGILKCPGWLEQVQCVSAPLPIVEKCDRNRGSEWNSWITPIVVCDW